MNNKLNRKETALNHLIIIIFENKINVDNNNVETRNSILLSYQNVFIMKNLYLKRKITIRKFLGICYETTFK